MAHIATCPKCTKQLGLPPSILATDRVECPECRAIFSLSETTEISLPVARVLDTSEQVVPEQTVVERHPGSAAAASDKPIPEPFAANTLSQLSSTSAPKESWEERLKRALALDSSDNDPLEEQVEGKKPTIDNAVSSSPACFELELDLDPPKRVEQGSSTSQTLADLATATKATDSIKTEDFAPSNESVASQTKVPSTDGAASVDTSLGTSHRDVTNTESPRRRRRSGWPKVAAYAVGPLVGSLLGLYGLLWWQGEKADYVGLSKVLPATMLPVERAEENIAESPLAESIPPKRDEEDEANEAKHSGVATLMQRDQAVRPATAEQPVPTIASEVRINAEEFVALVDAANSAAPDFVAGDLSTPESVRRKGQAYMKLCSLAEHYNFAQQPGLSPPLQTKAQQAEQLFQSLFHNVQLREELAHIASRWWKYEERPNSGFFLTGKVARTQPAKVGTVCWVQIGQNSPEESIPVWFKQDAYEIGAAVGVVGRVHSDGNDMLREFTGAQIVEAEYSYSL